VLKRKRRWLHLNLHGNNRHQHRHLMLFQLSQFPLYLRRLVQSHGQFRKKESSRTQGTSSANRINFEERISSEDRNSSEERTDSVERTNFEEERETNSRSCFSTYRSSRISLICRQRSNRIRRQTCETAFLTPPATVTLSLPGGSSSFAPPPPPLGSHNSRATGSASPPPIVPPASLPTSLSLPTSTPSLLPMMCQYESRRGLG